MSMAQHLYYGSSATILALSAQSYGCGMAQYGPGRGLPLKLSPIEPLASLQDPRWELPNDPPRDRARSDASKPRTAEAPIRQTDCHPPALPPTPPPPFNSLPPPTPAL